MTDTSILDAAIAFHARALISKLLEGMWQPSDTAPRGQWLLTCREGETYSTIAMRGFGDEWISSSGHTTVTSHTYLPPTHWQPLPAPISTKGYSHDQRHPPHRPAD